MTKRIEVKDLAVPSDLLVVGGLNDKLVELFGWDTDARSVWLSEERLEHIRSRRNNSAEANFCILNIPRVLEAPIYWRVDRKHDSSVAIVGVVDERPLLVGLKFVPQSPARSYIDEIWVRTAFPLSTNLLKSSAEIAKINLLIIGA